MTASVATPASGPGTIPGPTRSPGRARSRSRRPPVLLVVPAVVGCVVALLPFAYLADQALQRGWANVVDELWRSRTVELIGRSLALTAIVTGACSVIGVSAAWLVARTDVPGGRLWQILLTAPLAIPSYVAAFAWISWQPSMPALVGASLVLTLVSFPFVFLPVVAALRHLDPAQEEVARSLGRSPLQVALRVTLRQVRPAAAAGALLVALYALSDFGAVATMRYEAFTWVIYGAYRAGFNPSRAAILALVLAAVAVVVVLAEGRSRGRASAARVGTGTARRQTPLPLGRWRYPAAGYLGAIVALALGFPAWQLVRWFQESVRGSVDVGELLTVLGHTLWFSLLATLAVLVLAVPVGILAARFRSRAVVVVERSTYVAHALPGIVVAISLVFVGIRLLRPIYQQTPLLVLAYVVLFLPLAVGSVRASVEQAPVRLEEVARSLGRSPRQVLTRITMPLAAPGIAAGAALVFLTVMKELPATLLLHPTGVDTLATRLWTFTAETNYAAGAPYAAALVLLAAIPTALISFTQRDRPTGTDDAEP